MEEELDDNNEPAIGDVKQPESDCAGNDVDSEAFDKFLGIRVQIPVDDAESIVMGKVVGQKRDTDGRLIGASNNNPILNTVVYNVLTPDGIMHEYTANTIAEHIWAQVDEDGWDFRQIFAIIGHRKNSEAIPKEKGFVENFNRSRKRVIKTKGWDLKIKWEGGETSYIPVRMQHPKTYSRNNKFTTLLCT